MIEKLYKVAVCKDIGDSLNVITVIYNDLMHNYNHYELVKLNSLTADIITKYLNNNSLVYINKHRKYSEAMPNELTTKKPNEFESLKSYSINTLYDFINNEFIETSQYHYFKFMMISNLFLSKNIDINKISEDDKKLYKNDYNSYILLKKQFSELYDKFDEIEQLRMELDALTDNEDNTKYIKKIHKEILNKFHNYKNLI